MSGLRDVDPRSVITGALVDVAITVPAGFIAGSLDEDSNLVILFTLLVLAAPLFAGAVAARHHRRTSLMHGAIAAGVGWAVAITVSIIAKLIAGDGVPLLATVLLGVWSVSIGMIGGYVTFRRELRET
jgi:hypothetical protein